MKNSETPQERVYRFVRKLPDGQIEEKFVQESDLDHEQTAFLVKEVWDAFRYLPDIAQEMFIIHLQSQVSLDLAQLEEAKRKQSAILDASGMPADFSLLKGDA